MMARRRHILRPLRRLLAGQDGAIMTEAILVVPLLTFMAVGILEFGAVFWQREQIITGLRDAVRYVARCHPTVPGDYSACDDIAKKIAYYGTIAGGSDDDLRVPDWDAANSPITISRVAKDHQTVVSASTTHTVLHSPLFGFLGVDDVTMTLTHEQRLIGW